MRSSTFRRSASSIRCCAPGLRSPAPCRCRRSATSSASSALRIRTRTRGSTSRCGRTTAHRRRRPDAAHDRGPHAPRAAGRSRHRDQASGRRLGSVMAVVTKGILGRKLGMTQVFDEAATRDPRHGDRSRPVPHRAGPHTRTRRLLGDPARLRGGQGRQAQQARARPPQEGGAGRASPPRRAARRRRVAVRGRAGDQGRCLRSRRACGRRRHLEGQGLRRRHEASRLPRGTGQPRHRAQAPHAGFGRRRTTPQRVFKGRRCRDAWATTGSPF